MERDKNNEDISRGVIFVQVGNNTISVLVFSPDPHIRITVRPLATTREGIYILFVLKAKFNVTMVIKFFIGYSP